MGSSDEQISAALPPPAPEEYPRLFGSYTLLTSLARGGMGEVFLARHGSVAGLEKLCVVKTLRPHLTDDREYIARFIDEARIVVQLGHRNICHVFDVGTVGERYYLAMEHIAGKDLRGLAHAVFQQGGVMNPGLSVHIMCEVLEALDYAHRQVDAATGQPLLLVHRDVSPQNVMVSFEGEVKLIDFGLAASTLKMEQTSPNVVMGKLAYMAPEHVRGERVDGRADLFAAAVVLYELLIGERFYEGKSPYEIWGIAAQGGFRPRGFGALDEDMRAVLDRALAADADARFPSCLAFREALQHLRFSRALRGDGPLLRTLMAKLYADEIEVERRRLSMLLQAPLRTMSDRQGTRGVGALPDQSQSIARSASLQDAPASAHPRDEATGPTQRLAPPSPTARRRLLVAASVGAVCTVCAVVVVAFLQRTSSPTSLPPSAASDVAAVDDPGRATQAAASSSSGAVLVNGGGAKLSDAVTSPTMGPVIAESVSAPVPANATSATLRSASRAEASAAVAPTSASSPARSSNSSPSASVQSSSPSPSPSPASTSSAAAPSTTSPASAPASLSASSSATSATVLSRDVPGAPAAAAPQEPPTEVLRYRALSWEKRVEAIAAQCPSLPCLDEARAHVDDFGEFSKDMEAFGTWKDHVKACWKECGLP